MNDLCQKLKETRRVVVKNTHLIICLMHLSFLVIVYKLEVHSKSLLPKS